VDQARQQRRARQFDHPGIRRRFDLAGRPGAVDALAADQHYPAFVDLGRDTVINAGRLEQDGLSRRRRCRWLCADEEKSREGELVHEILRLPVEWGSISIVNLRIYYLGSHLTAQRGSGHAIPTIATK